MADANQAAADLAQALEKVTRELADLGKVSLQTQSELKDAQVKAKYGIENYTKGTEKAAEGVMALGRGAAAAGRAMLDGKKGAAALNSSLDELSTAATAAGAALALMVPGGILIKGLIAGVTAMSTAAFKYAKEANIMADQLHKGYQGLSKAGGAAADGMSGLKRDAQKLGYAMGELDQMVSIVAENSKDFALFAGSVSEGRKRFADLGEAMTPARQELMNMGMSMQDINEGAAGYIRLQTQTGRAQKMTTEQLAKGAADYLKEMDGLTKLTGQNRQELQTQRERMLQQEQSAAKLRSLELAGRGDAANRLQELGNMLKQAGPGMEAAFNASITGNLSSADAQKANLASQGELIRSIKMVESGQISAAEGAQRVAKAMGNTSDRVGSSLGQLGAYEDKFGSIYEQQKLRIAAENNFVVQLDKINKDSSAQRAGADKITDNQSKLIQAQIDANKAMTDFVFAGIAPAQKQMIALTDATKHAANALNKVTGSDKGTAMGAAQGAGVGAAAGALLGGVIGLIGGPAGAILGAKIGTVAGAGLGAVVGGYLGGDKTPDGKEVPKGADGGMFSGPTSGYLAMLHGNELVIPEDQLMGKVSTGGMAGAGGDQLDKMTNLYKEMLKDTIALEKLTDADLKRKREYDKVEKRLFDLKMEAMEDEIDHLENPTGMIGSGLKMLSAAAGGQGGGNRGQGIKAPSAGQAPGGQGIKTSSTDLLQFGGNSGSASNFEELNGRLKEAVINAATEYNSLTGKKLKINSAKRDPEDQIRLYQETVDAGRPGIGPNGMPVGKPGTSSHEKGLAVDIQNYNDPAAVSALNRQGLHQVVPKDPVHFQLSGETGMIADGPESGYQATLHGKEAVIPMQNNSGDFVKMFAAMAESSARMVDMMEQMVSAQKNSVDVQNKMLRAQA